MTYNATYGHAEDWELRDVLTRVLMITGDTRLLIGPITYTGTSVADYASKSHSVTATESVATWVSHAVRGTTYLLNGTDEHMYHADHADFTFGTGAADSAFSVFAFANSASILGDTYILSKIDLDSSLFEWGFYLSNGKPWFQIFDDDAGAHLARYRNTASTAATWYTYMGTYDGTSLIGGIKVYLNGSRVDDTSDTIGAYVAMEDTAAGLGVGCVLNASPSAAGRWNGNIGMIGICAKELSAIEVWNLNRIIRGYFLGS